MVPTATQTHAHAARKTAVAAFYVAVFRAALAPLLPPTPNTQCCCNINEMARELPRMRGLALLVVVGCRCDYYESLNVPRDASAEKIKAAYRRAALREHPDKQHGRSQTARAAAATRMERLNEAYATLLDPVSRRRYDLGRANPHYHDAYHHQQSSSYQPRVIKVTLSCTLEQLGGYAQVEVDLRKALGLPGSYHMPPLRVFLPPGSRSGDRHRIALPHMGAVLILKLTYETPHPVYSRDGADLEMSMWLPAWYNHPWWRRGVTVRSICGGRHLVCAGGECVPLAGKVRTLICTCMRMCMGICMRMCMCVCIRASCVGLRGRWQLRCAGWVDGLAVVHIGVKVDDLEFVKPRGHLRYAESGSHWDQRGIATHGSHNTVHTWAHVPANT